MALKFAVDIVAKKLLLSYLRPEPFTLPAFVQGDTYPVEIQLCEPNYAAGFGAYSLVNISNYSLRMAVMGHKPVGNAADTPEVLQTSWNKDTSTNVFSGVLAFGSSIATLLGTASVADAYAEIELRDLTTGYYSTIYPWAPCTVKAEVIEDGALVTPPVTGGTTLTIQEGNQLYVKRRGLPGEGYSIVSANSSWERIFYLDDDGNLLSSLVPYVP